MFSKRKMSDCIENCSDNMERAARAIAEANAIVVGIGAGMSASAGMSYSGERFEKYFSDFAEKYQITDMYSGGFYPFPTLEEFWAWWSRQVYINRYDMGATKPYINLLKLLEGKNFFVITTNVDHQLQLAGIDRQRLYYTQGDYGLWQCSVPCHRKNYDNESMIREMVRKQKNMRVPSELIPYCPNCGAPMMMNLRVDGRFVEDEGWHTAQNRYGKFIAENINKKIVFLELGVGKNTPGIIQYPFMRMTLKNELATYIPVNFVEYEIPQQIEGRTIRLTGDIGEVVEDLLIRENRYKNIKVDGCHSDSNENTLE